MNKNDHMDKLVEDALISVDDATRAEPRPFLLTRINARMNKRAESAWEKAGKFITRPAVAFTGLCMILLVNVIVIVSNKTSTVDIPTEQVAQNSTDEFSYAVATIYDNENTQP